MRVRLFSDGGLREGLATWAAAAFFYVEGLWRLAAAAAGVLEPPATVPEAELHGAAQAWQLEAELRARRDCVLAAPICTGLTAVEIYALEVWTTLQWAAPGDE